MVDFVYSVSGLKVSFRILSKVPAEIIPDWDFGDDIGKSNQKQPIHTYETSGFYTVTLKLNGETCVKQIIVSEHSKTHLTDSIYVLIDYYIPKKFSESMTFGDKALYINKWQLYIQPLVNHDIPLEEYSNELYYEGLENQLVMELAVYDFLYNRIINLLISTGDSLDKISSGEISQEVENGIRGDRIKQITTGPSEVQYYDSVTESLSSLFKYYSQAIQPGGMLDELRINLCALASRLEIFLPFCNNPSHGIMVPKVVNRREPGLIGGPNPPSLVNKSGDTLLKLKGKFL